MGKINFYVEQKSADDHNLILEFLDQEGFHKWESAVYKHNKKELLFNMLRFDNVTFPDNPAICWSNYIAVDEDLLLSMAPNMTGEDWFWQNVTPNENFTKMLETAVAISV